MTVVVVVVLLWVLFIVAKALIDPHVRQMRANEGLIARRRQPQAQQQQQQLQYRLLA